MSGIFFFIFASCEPVIPLPQNYSPSYTLPNRIPGHCSEYFFESALTRIYPSCMALWQKCIVILSCCYVLSFQHSPVERQPSIALSQISCNDHLKDSLTQLCISKHKIDLKSSGRLYGGHVSNSLGYQLYMMQYDPLSILTPFLLKLAKK